jgi:CRP-like cAMP-binding protein
LTPAASAKQSLEHKHVMTLFQQWPRGSFLGRLQASQAEELVLLGTRAVFPNRHVLIRQGSSDDHFVLLTKGLVKVVVDTEGGHEALLAVRMGGDLVGEMASLGGQPRSASVVTCVETTARLIPSDLFTGFLKKHPGILYEVTRMLSERLRWANEQRVAFASLPVRVRAARILVEAAQTYGLNGGRDQWNLTIPLTHSEIASFCGISLSSAEKSLRWLEEKGVIARGYGDISITSMPRLREIAGYAQLDENP